MQNRTRTAFYKFGSAGGQQTTAVGGRGVFKKEWLTDYNCDSGDAGSPHLKTLCRLS